MARIIMEAVADKFRRYCLDYRLPVSVIPRNECVRIVDKVTIDPDIDITIYPKTELDIDNISSDQYQVIVKQDDRKEMSFTKACKIISEVVDELNVR